jgi:hypothetical protein
MVDVVQKIANLLKPLAPVELAGSEKELTLPSIYITQLSNMTDVAFDKKDFLTSFTYQIDIYAETPKKCAEMAQAVDNIMQPEGWQRSNAQPFGRQRYILTYRSLVSEKHHTYKE